MKIKEKIKNIFKKKDYSITDARALNAAFPILFNSSDNYVSFAYACINVERITYHKQMFLFRNFNQDNGGS